MTPFDYMKYLLNYGLSVFLAFFIIWGCSKPPEDSISGCWQLSSWDAYTPDGNHVFPYGEDARGELCLIENRLSLTLALADRVKLGNLNRSSIPDSTLAATTKSFFHYSGPYTLQDSILTLHVEYCNVPDWEDSTFKRIVHLENGSLKILSPGVSNLKHTLIWSKKED